MKKRILFLLLTVMTLLSNTVFSQVYTYTISTTPTTTTTAAQTETFNIGLVDDPGQTMTTADRFMPILSRANGDSIIYEFTEYTGYVNLNFQICNAASTHNGKFYVINLTNPSTYTSSYATINAGLITTSTLNFTLTPSLYKIILQIDSNAPTITTLENKFICYVRNYQVAKLPSNTVIPFVANFSSSVTSYTATSVPTTITLPAPTSTVTWTQVLSYTTSNCVTYTEGTNVLQDCDTLTTLFISNNNSNVNYTITYNRPAQDITSVKEVKSVTSIVTYPNPCKDFIKVKFNVEQSVLPIELYNLQGQLLLQNNEKRKHGDNEIEFNTQKLPNGVYFVKNGTQTVKFIKE